MYIYKITNNINGKSYIGLKSKAVEESENYYGSGTLINKAIDKYGKENFTKEILERDINSHEILNDREIYWIEYFNTFNEGYNLTRGGQGNLGRVISKETRKKLSEAAKKQFRNGVSEEVRERIRQKAIGRKKSPHSKETKFKIAKAATGRIMSQEERDKIADAVRNALKGKSLPKTECPHCGKIGAKPHLTRWHFDNCKKYQK